MLVTYFQKAKKILNICLIAVSLSSQILVLFLFAGVFGAGAYGCMRVEDGLDLSDVVPRHTKEHSFIESQFKYFSFYQIFAVTMKDFDYPRSQKLLYRYHEAFAGVSLTFTNLFF